MLAHCQYVQGCIMTYVHKCYYDLIFCIAVIYFMPHSISQYAELFKVTVNSMLIVYI